MLERLIESLENCPTVKRGSYDYFIHPITDGVPEVDPALLRDVCTGMVKLLDLQDVELFVVAEAMDRGLVRSWMRRWKRWSRSSRSGIRSLSSSAPLRRGKTSRYPQTLLVHREDVELPSRGLSPSLQEAAAD
jgi:hypothetical protein